MFSIGFLELLLIAIITLMVFGPERLPSAIRTFVYNFAKFKRSWQNTKRTFEQELGIDEMRRDIHNAQVLENLESIKVQTQQKISDAESEIVSDLTGQSLPPNTDPIPKVSVKDKEAGDNRKSESI